MQRQYEEPGGCFAGRPGTVLFRIFEISEGIRSKGESKKRKDKNMIQTEKHPAQKFCGEISGSVIK